MTCLYPHNAPRTAYSKGCRCEQCVDAYRARPTEIVPYEQRSPAAQARYPVPLAPVLAVVERWLADYERETRVNAGALERGSRIEPGQPLTAEQALEHRCGYKRGGIARRLWAWRHGEQTHLGWDTADRIVTACYGPHVWQNDPELRALCERQARAPELLDDRAIAAWAVDVRASLTPLEWAEVQRDLHELVPNEPGGDDRWFGLLLDELEAREERVKAAA